MATHPRTRDERRALSERWKWRVRRYYVFRSREMNDARKRGLYSQTRKLCSCFMCGNPRRHWKSRKWRLTLQERRAA